MQLNHRQTADEIFRLDTFISLTGKAGKKPFLDILFSIAPGQSYLLSLSSVTMADKIISHILTKIREILYRFFGRNSPKVTGLDSPVTNPQQHPYKKLKTCIDDDDDDDDDEDDNDYDYMWVRGLRFPMHLGLY
jgi:hypothetical protein